MVRLCSTDVVLGTSVQTVVMVASPMGRGGVVKGAWRGGKECGVERVVQGVGRNKLKDIFIRT